jgi:integrase
VVKVAHSFKNKKSGIWYFKLRVPSALIPIIGKEFWEGSLKTRDDRLARDRAFEKMREARRHEDAALLKLNRDTTLGDMPLQAQRIVEDAGGVDGLAKEVAAYAKGADLMRATLGALTERMVDFEDGIFYELEVPRAERQQAEIEEAASKGARAKIEEIIRAHSRILVRLGVEVEEARKIEKLSTPGLPEVLDHYAKETAMSDTTRRQYNYAVRRFTELHGDLPMGDFKLNHLRDFSDKILAVPISTKRMIQGLPILEAIDEAKRLGLRTTSHATRQKHVYFLKALSTYAVQVGFAAEDRFRLFKLRKQKRKISESDDERRPSFDVDDVTLILDETKRFKSPSISYWGPRFALYQGTRLEETCQLRPGNVYKRNDVLCVEITDRGEGQTLKNRPSLRTIPVHKALLDLGFEEISKSRKGQKLLFSEIKLDSDGRHGGNYSKRFADLLAKIGVRVPFADRARDDPDQNKTFCPSDEKVARQN